MSTADLTHLGEPAPESAMHTLERSPLEVASDAHYPASSSSSSSPCSSSSASKSCGSSYGSAVLDHPWSGFEGKVCIFQDGSHWQIRDQLSSIKLQQMHSPCEGTQVFTCTRVEAPSCKYGDIEEAVVKVKFQVRATEETIRDFQVLVQEFEEDLQLRPDCEGMKKALVDHEEGLYLCTEPTSHPNDDTWNEIDALDRLRTSKCKSAPWLLDLAEGVVEPGMHEEGMLGGYITYLLMTKLPAERLTYQEYWSWSLEKRDEVRRAFKEALIDVWNCGVQPCDKALRNILWDEEKRKCYIVDFEECKIVDVGSQNAPKFKDNQYDFWDLAEKRFRGWG